MVTKPGDISYSLSTRFGGKGLGLILTHKFFCLVAQPFQAVRKSWLNRPLIFDQRWLPFREIGATPTSLEKRLFFESLHFS